MKNTKSILEKKRNNSKAITSAATCGALRSGVMSQKEEQELGC